jgi:hypothetical protein
MNGLELAHTVKARWPGIEILVTCAARWSGALPLGGRFLQRPFIPMALVGAVRDMLTPAEPVMRTPVLLMCGATASAAVTKVALHATCLRAIDLFETKDETLRCTPLLPPSAVVSWLP